MRAGPWRIRLTAAAQQDFRSIRGWTARRFGTSQADAYCAAIVRLLGRLADGPDSPGSLPRAEFDPPLRSLHLAVLLPRARHLVLYRAQDDRTVAVLRILHDAMEVSGKLPGQAKA